MKTNRYFSLGLDYYGIMDLKPTDLLKFLKLLSREEIINWLQWNDPNGVYLDSASLLEFGTIISKKEGIDIILRQIGEN